MSRVKPVKIIHSKILLSPLIHNTSVEQDHVVMWLLYVKSFLNFSTLVRRVTFKTLKTFILFIHSSIHRSFILFIHSLFIHSLFIHLVHLMVTLSVLSAILMKFSVFNLVYLLPSGRSHGIAKLLGVIPGIQDYPIWVICDLKGLRVLSNFSSLFTHRSNRTRWFRTCPRHTFWRRWTLGIPFSCPRCFRLPHHASQSRSGIQLPRRQRRGL